MAMSSENPAPVAIPDTFTSPATVIILTIVLLVFFFVGFFSIYFCRCCMQNMEYTIHNRASSSGAGTTAVSVTGPPFHHPGGLDKLIINSFPTFTYESVKDYRREKYGLECAICLCEFEDESILKLLTNCCHVFHQDCIELWLESHNSCPVCRQRLDEIGKSPEKSPLAVLSMPGGSTTMHDIDENEPLEDHSYHIYINDELGSNDAKTMGPGDQMAGVSMQIEEHPNHDELDKFSRSNSTGHSIVSKTVVNEEDKYKLILPEHVKAKLMRGHCVIKSCTCFGEFKSRTCSGNGGFGEVSGLSTQKIPDKV